MFTVLKTHIVSDTEKRHKSVLPIYPQIPPWWKNKAGECHILYNLWFSHQGNGLTLLEILTFIPIAADASVLGRFEV